jgi:hypothetical protein
MTAMIRATLLFRSTLRPVVSEILQQMPSCRSSRIAIVTVLGSLLSFSANAAAQRGGGHVPHNMLTRPDAVDDKDTLKDFHQALAVQATSQQIAEFQALLKTTDSARTESEKFVQHPQSGDSVSALGQALEAARSQTKQFIDGFSDKQKSGLKEQTRLLDRADAALADQQRKLGQAIQSSSPAGELANDATAVDKSLADFSSQQLSLAREMGIVLANPQDVTFNLPAVKNTVTVGLQLLQVRVSSLLSQTAAGADKRTFRLEMMGDLSDFQQNITELLRAAVNSDRTCGERLSVQRAMLMPSAPASTLHLQLHYERWACLRLGGSNTSTELAENDGEVELRLLPTMGATGLQLKTDFDRIDTNGMMADSLRSGDLGSDLREKVTQAFLTAMRPATDLKTELPPALGGSTLETAKFEDVGAGDLALMLEGQAQLSEEQAKSLVSQLNQTLAAEGNGTK